jgi:hypothetical protein
VLGRKIDLSDAEWLADVAAHGMARPSFVPLPIRELTQYRKTQVDARGNEIQRLEKVLQDGGIKLTSVECAVGESIVELGDRSDDLRASVIRRRWPPWSGPDCTPRSVSWKRPLAGTSDRTTPSSPVRSSSTSIYSTSSLRPLRPRSPHDSPLLCPRLSDDAHPRRGRVITLPG